MQKTDENNTIIDFLLSFVLLTGAYLGQIVAYRIGTDSEIAYLSDDSLVWLQQGRWLTYLFEQYLYTNPIVPAFAILLFVGLYSWSCLSFLKDIAGLSRSNAVLLTLVSGSFISWTYLIAFPANLFPFAVAIVLAFISARLFDASLKSVRKKSYRDTALSLGLIIGLGSMIAGIYEAGLILFACLSGIVLFCQLNAELEHQPTRETPSKTSDGFKLIAQFCVLLIVAIILAYCLSNLICAVMLNFRDSSRVVLHHNISIHNVLDAPLMEISELLRLVGSYAGGSEAIYGQFTLAPILVVLAFLLATISALFMNWRKTIFAILIAGGVFFVAGSLNLISLNYGALRMSIAFPIAFLCLMVIETMWRPNYLKKLIPAVYFLCFVLNAYVLSLVGMSEINIRRYDENLAFDIADAAIELADAKPGDLIFLDVHGQPSYEHRGPKFDSSPTGVSVFSWWPARHRSVIYIRAMGFEEFHAPSDAQHEENGDFAAQMPAWPREGSMVMKDGIIVLKF